MAFFNLQQIPNQTFNFSNEDVYYTVALRSIAGTTYATITINDVISVRNMPCIMNQEIIPYPYKNQNAGNFKFSGNGDEYPEYTTFNTASQLQFITIAGDAL